MVQHRRADRPELGHLLEEAVADARVQLHDQPLVLRERTALEEDPFADPELADVVQQRCEHELLALVRRQIEPPCDGRDERRHLVAMAAEEWILRADRLGEDAHGRDVRVAQAPLQARVVQGHARLVTEREQQLVVVLVEAARLVRGDDDAVEPLADVERDRDQILDLRRCTEVLGVIDAERLLLRKRLLREMLDHRLGLADRRRTLAARRGRGRRLRRRQCARAGAPWRRRAGRLQPAGRRSSCRPGCVCEETPS